MRCVRGQSLLTNTPQNQLSNEKRMTTIGTMQLDNNTREEWDSNVGITASVERRANKGMKGFPCKTCN